VGPAEEAPSKGDTASAKGQVLLLTSISAISFFLFGYDTGVVSGAFAWVRDDLNLSDIAYETLVGVTTAAAALGAVGAAGLNESFGRNPCIVLASVLFSTGAAVMALTPTNMGATFAFWLLFVGRVTVGLAIGLATVTVPMYISEAAPPETRGFLLVLNDLSVVTGQFVAGLVNVGFDHAGRIWRASVGLALIPGALQFVGFLFLPESPRWLCQRGRVEEARAVLRKLRDGEHAVADELSAIRAEVEVIQREREALGLTPTPTTGERAALNGSGATRTGLGLGLGIGAAFGAQTGEASLWDLRAYWGHAPVRRAMTLGVVLMAMNQFAGINTVMYYSVAMMEMAGFNNEQSVLIACACDFAQMCGVIYSLFRMDVLGRRALALQSTALVMPTLLLLAVAFWIGNGVLALVALMLYLPAFGSGLSGVPWTVNSEIYPLSVRSLAVSQATAANWAFNSVVSFSFVSLSSAIGAGQTFLIYLSACIVGGAWLYAKMPETNGLGLEEVSQLFEKEGANFELAPGRLCTRLTGKWGYEQVDDQGGDDDEGHLVDEDSKAERFETLTTTHSPVVP